VDIVLFLYDLELPQSLTRLLYLLLSLFAQLVLNLLLVYTLALIEVIEEGSFETNLEQMGIILNDWQ
jgi:hypothetical protein